MQAILKRTLGRTQFEHNGWRALCASMSVVVALAAIFGLSAWAESGPLQHAVQHVLIFSAGAGLSGAVLAVRRPKKEDL